MQLGYIVARVFSSNAQIPISNASLTVISEKDGETKLLGSRVTDRNGKTDPIPIEAPDKSLSMTAGNDNPFTVVDLKIYHPDYSTFYVKNAQVFAGEVSVQDAEMLPINEYTAAENRIRTYDVSKQDL